MSNQTQQQIDTIIQAIHDAEDPGEITNLIVAAVLAFLSDKAKTMATTSDLSTEVSALEAVDASLNQAIQNEAAARQGADSVETNARIAADTALSGRITSLQDALNTLMNGDVTDAIESFNEVLSFLAGVTDDKTLTGLLTAINDRLNGVDEDLEEKADLHTRTGKVVYSQMPDVVLASMGSDLDNVNAPSGTAVQYVPSYRDYYFDTNDSRIKYVDSGGTLRAFAPEPGLIYCNKMTNLTYRWTGSGWRQVGGGPGGAIDVINNLIAGGTDKALSAEMGKELKSKINEVYQALQSVYSLLGNAAFWDNKPSVATVLPDLNWNSTMYAVTINKVNNNIVVKRNGVPVGSSFQAEEGSSVTLTFEGSSTYEVLSVTVNGTSVQKVNGVFTYSFVVNGNTSLTINGEGNTITAPITVNKTLNGCTMSNETATPSAGGSYHVKVTPPSGKYITNLEATMDNGNGGTTSIVPTKGADLGGNSPMCSYPFEIDIANITGDISIVATVEDIYTKDKAYSENSINGRTLAGWFVCNVYIPVNATSILYVHGVSSYSQQGCIVMYDSNGEYFAHSNAWGSSNGAGPGCRKVDKDSAISYCRASFVYEDAQQGGSETYTASETGTTGGQTFDLGVYAKVNDEWVCCFNARQFLSDIKGE